MKEVLLLPDPPVRPRDGHKGTFGTVAVLAGSHGMLGAAILAARALSGARGKRLQQIFDQVLGVFEPDRQPHQAICDSGAFAFLGRKGPMGGGGRVDCLCSSARTAHSNRSCLNSFEGWVRGLPTPSLSAQC